MMLPLLNRSKFNDHSDKVTNHGTNSSFISLHIYYSKSCVTPVTVKNHHSD